MTNTTVNRKVYTPSEVLMIRKLVQAGYRNGEIAEAVERTEKAIGILRCRLGWSFDRLFKSCPLSFKYILKRRLYTEYEIRLIAKWRRAGFCYAEIGGAIGRGEASICRRIRKSIWRLTN